MKKILQCCIGIFMVLLLSACVGKHNIHDAAKNGNITEIESFLDKGGDIELSPPRNPWTGGQIFDGNKLLHMAVEASERSMIEFLLENNASIEARNSSGNTPLLLSSKYGLIDISELLLKNNANIFTKNNEGNTVLHTTIKNFKDDEQKVLKHLSFFLKQKASVNVQNNWLDTPVHMAARYDLVDVLKLLEKHGAKLDIKNRYEDTPLSLSLGLNFSPKATIKTSKVFDYLIEKKLNIHTKNNKAQTLLHRTCNPEYIEKLIKKGVSIHEKGQYGQSAPFFALQKCAKASLLKYLEYGFNINSKTEKKESALFLAFKNVFFKKEIIDTLIEHKINIQQTNKYGETLLHKASHHDSPEMIDLALQHGIDINARTKNNATPLHTASSIHVYPNKGIDPTLSTYKHLLKQKGIDLNVQDKKGCTALIRTISNGNFQKAHLLLEKGANPNIKEKRGHTALDVAMLSRNPNKSTLIKLLKLKGAKTNINPAPKKNYSIICSYP